ncbi:MAG: caspase family protein [Elusimicrobia bacterium]|nr:caspase family protein [Elusimicrobiota bacterium]
MRLKQAAYFSVLLVAATSWSQPEPGPVTADQKLSAAFSAKTLKPLPTPRGEFAGGIVDGKLYIIGGLDVNGPGPGYIEPSAAVEVYDFATNRWTTQKPMPAARTHVFSAVFRGKIYVIGGCLIATCPDRHGDTGRVDIYDPRTDTWTPGRPAPISRYHGQAAVLGGRIYLPGGWSRGDHQSSVDVYDPASDSWSSATPMPHFQAAAGVAAAEGKLYVIGGNDEKGDTGRVQIYDPGTKAWSSGPEMPGGPRNFLSAAVMENKIHALGGLIPYTTGLGEQTDEVFDPARNAWQTAPPMTAPHLLFAAFSDDKRIVAVGGSSTSDLFQSSIDILDAGASKWRGNGSAVRRVAQHYIQVPPTKMPPTSAPPIRQQVPAFPNTSDVDSYAGRAKPREDDFALIVGIEDYRGIPKAAFGSRDAQTFKRYAQSVLGVPEENIIFLEGDKAARTDLVKYVEEWLPRNVSKDSRVYFYYSGHGAPDPSKGTAYLVPWDGDPQFLDSTAYPVSRLYEKLGELKSKETLVLLDTCFSGMGGRSVIAKNLRPLVSVIEAPRPKLKRLSVLTAASGDEVAGGLEAQQHGLFTYYLLKGLKGEADANHDGHVELGELYDFVNAKVRRAAHRENREQNPKLQSSELDLELF